MQAVPLVNAGTGRNLEQVAACGFPRPDSDYHQGLRLVIPGLAAILPAQPLVMYGVSGETLRPEKKFLGRGFGAENQNQETTR